MSDSDSSDSVTSDSDSSECDFSKTYGNGNILPYDSLLGSLLKDRFLCDVTIRVQKSTLPAHRLILSAASCFFHDLFKNSVSINQGYDLTDIFVIPENLDQIITYIYKGIINIKRSNVVPLLTVNEVLRISSLNNHCAQFLLSRLRPLNALEIWQIAWTFNLQELINVSLIVSRETMCNSIIVKYDIIMLREEFICLLLANEEVMATVLPSSVVLMLSWWTNTQIDDSTERAEKFLSLLDIYLKWKILSKNEFKIVRKQTVKCFESDQALVHRILSWSRAKLAAIEENHDEENNKETLDPLHGWSLLVAEREVYTVGIYCNTKSRWFTTGLLLDDTLKVIGLKNNSLVYTQNSNDLLLKDVNNMTLQTVPSRYTNDDSVKCLNGQRSTFFMHADNIYSVDAVIPTNEKDIVCIINRFDQETNEWITVLHLNPELSNDVLSVSFTVETYDSDDVYLFVAVRRPYMRGENTSKSTAFIEKRGTSFGEENPGVYQRSLKTFCVFCIDMKSFVYRLIGKRVNHLADLSTSRKIILHNKIIFLLDPDKDLERKFGYAYYNRNDCFLYCLELILDGENTWKNLSLRAPFPDVRDISIRKRDCTCLDCSVATCKNLLFVGTHWSPHVFQVFMYDISTLIVSSLPSIPLPAIRRLSIYALLTSKPISNVLRREIRLTDLVNFHLKDWSLLSWSGTLI